MLNKIRIDKKLDRNRQKDFISCLLGLDEYSPYVTLFSVLSQGFFFTHRKFKKLKILPNFLTHWSVQYRPCFYTHSHKPMEIHKWFELSLNDKMSLANTSVTINVINICLKTVHTAILNEKKMHYSRWATGDQSTNQK